MAMFDSSLKRVDRCNLDIPIGSHKVKHLALQHKAVGPVVDNDMIHSAIVSNFQLTNELIKGLPRGIGYYG